MHCGEELTQGSTVLPSKVCRCTESAASRAPAEGRRISDGRWNSEYLRWELIRGGLCSALPLLGGDFGARTYLETALTLTGRDKMASVSQGAGSQLCCLLLSPAPLGQCSGKIPRQAEGLGCSPWVQAGRVAALPLSHAVAVLLLGTQQRCSWLWALLIPGSG